MTHAYSEMYLSDAMNSLGEAFDYAANSLNIPMDEFLEEFIVSGIAEKFAAGEPKYVSGLSGTELALNVLHRTQNADAFFEPKAQYDCSAEYWCGWILAFYQWHTGKSFKEIRNFLPMDEIYRLYPTLHEAAEEKFLSTANSILERKNPPSKLQAVRKAAGLSQKELSEKSGVTLRMIQQYEQRAKDINKATASNLFALSKTLGCRAEDLLE